MAGDLALEEPEGTVTVEDAITEEVGEEGIEARAFRVDGEAGFEQMVYNEGIDCGEDGGATDDNAAGERGAAVEELAGPGVQAVLVEEHGGEAAEDGQDG